MTDAGYTLTETLAALAVLGMAVGALSLGAQVVGSLQLSTGKAVKQLQSGRMAQGRLEALLARGAPFGSQAPDQLSGDAAAFHFSCGETAPCTVQVVTTGSAYQLKVADGATPSSAVVLPLAGDAHLIYLGSKGPSAVWPPSAPDRQALRSVAVLQTTSEGDVTVVEAKVWAEQPAQCAFDPVAQACR